MLSGGTPRELLRALARRGRRALPGRARASASARPSASWPSCARRSARPTTDDHDHPRRGDDPRTLARDGLLELGFTPQEADRLLDGAAGDRPRSSSPTRCKARPRPIDPHARRRRIQTPGTRTEEDDSTARCARGASTTSSASTPSRSQLGGLDRGGARARRGARPRPARRPARASARPRSRRSSPTSSSVDFVQTAGPALERKGDIAALLTALEPSSVFFVDEIHRLPRALEETFYPAMEDRQLPITIGQGAGARVVTLDLPPFTLDRRDDARRAAHDAAARPLRHPAPARARTTRPTSRAIVARSAAHPRRRDRAARAPARSPARRAARPRVANRLLKRVRDFAEVRGAGHDRRRGRRRRARPARDRRRGPRPPRPRAARDDLRALRRRPGRAVDARRRGGRGGRHDRGRLRALPAAAGLPAAHAARAAARRARAYAHLGLEPPAPTASDSSEPCLPLRRDGAPVHLPELRQPHDRDRAHRRLPQRAARLREVRLRLPVRAARRLLPGAERRVLRLRPAGPRDRLRPRVLRADRPRDERVIGRAASEVLGLQFDDGADHVGTVLEWGVRAARQAGAASTPRAICPRGPSQTSSPPTTTTGVCCSS